MADEDLLIGPEVIEKVVLDYLRTEAVFNGWKMGTKIKPDETPDRFIQVKQIDGDSPNLLLYHYYLQFRVWDKSEYVAQRFCSALIAYLRRGIGARVTTLPVPLPDTLDTSRNFYQFAVIVPRIGTQPAQ